MNLDNLKFNTTKTVGNNNIYLTHNFHPYAAKFIPKIPEISIKFFTKPKETVLDPFCGIGTTLVEAKMLCRKAIGVDIHPISILASKAKTTKIKNEYINLIDSIIEKIEIDILNFYEQKSKKSPKKDLLSFIYSNEKKFDIIEYDLPKFKGIDHWYQQHVTNELSIIKAHILKNKDERLIRFLLCGFSAILIVVSNQESETRYAAIKKEIKPGETFSKFKKKIQDMKDRIIIFNKKASDQEVQIFEKDTRTLDEFIKQDTIDHIVTSPPYANVYDYYLYHKQRILWLDRDYTYVRDNEIGSRTKYSSKKENPSVFFENLKICFQNFSKVLKPNKFITLVIGDSIIDGKLIKVNKKIEQIAHDINLLYVKEFAFLQKKHSKSFNPRFTNVKTNKNNIKNEYIIILQNNK